MVADPAAESKQQDEGSLEFRLDPDLIWTAYLIESKRVKATFSVSNYPSGWRVAVVSEL